MGQLAPTYNHRRLKQVDCCELENSIGYTVSSKLTLIRVTKYSKQKQGLYSN